MTIFRLNTKNIPRPVLIAGQLLAGAGVFIPNSNSYLVLTMAVVATASCFINFANKPDLPSVNLDNLTQLRKTKFLVAAMVLLASFNSVVALGTLSPIIKSNFRGQSEEEQTKTAKNYAYKLDKFDPLQPIHCVYQTNGNTISFEQSTFGKTHRVTIQAAYVNEAVGRMQATKTQEKLRNITFDVRQPWASAIIKTP